jgi:hypothetical protein
MADDAAGNERPVRSQMAGRVRIGRALSASCTRSVEPARRPAGSILARSSRKRAERRCAVSTAPSAVTLTPSRKNASHASQSPFAPNLVQQRVIVRPALFEIKAEIQERLAQHARIAEQERDQEPPHASVAVEKGVDGLELYVGEPGAHEDRQPVSFGVEEALERRHAVLDRGVGWRHEVRVPGRVPPIQF